MSKTFDTSENKYYKEFKINNVDVSMVNSLRRICLSNIQTYVIKENDIDIQENTSRFNNEVIKQRIQCIPVHILDNSDEKDNNKFLRDTQGNMEAVHPEDIPVNVESIILKVQEKNEGQTTKYVTTQDIKLYASVDGIINEEEIEITRNNKEKIKLSTLVFPADYITNDHIVIARLKPPVENNLPGESLHFTAKFSLGTAKENGSFNVVSTCTYENRVDVRKSDTYWKDNKSKELEKAGVGDRQMDMEKKNWDLLNGRRERYIDSTGEEHNFCFENAFDFKIETVGVYSNLVILQKACLNMHKICEEFIQSTGSFNTGTSRHVKVTHNRNTPQPYEFCVVLDDEDYTLGNTLRHFINDKYIKGKNKVPVSINTTDIITDTRSKEEDEEGDDSSMTTITYDISMTYIGFKVPHPHIPKGVMRIIFEYKEEDENIDITEHEYLIASKLEKATKEILIQGAEDMKTAFSDLSKQLNPSK